MRSSWSFPARLRTGISLAFLVALGLAACPAQNTPQPMPPPMPPPSDAYRPPDPGGAPAPAPGKPAARPADPDDDLDKPILGNTGDPCETGADCESGTCEGPGCGARQGVCAAQRRACTRDLAAYCGCDGKTFRSSGSCAGQRFQYRGECRTALDDGARCADGRECASGVCEGKGCGAEATGTCVAQRRACTKDRRPYCGCDGKTFFGSGSCPGKRFSAAGECAK